ncbi:aquaporin [Pyricularia oryzae 70-15]|uniref:Aquaporin n=1 Tax=Pyricularia oryzae (strain 70-15 / ATCC MYA-4617 / FGSC 8958) TaxID=242507 RepID=G4NIP4_PYRO7|nr:aquaporin [Pyricularia oryzae 70-15]EHA47300.1 aquaporin [Pyricularia oryzae 70-15]
MASDEQTSTTPITVVLPTVTPSTNISNAADTAPSSRSSSRASTSQRLHSLDNTTTHVSPTHSLNVSYPATEASHKKQTYPPFQDHFSASSTRRSKPEDQSSLGRPGSKMALSPILRNHGTAALAELVGTFLFLFFAFSAAGVANAVPPEFSDGIAVPNIAALLYISFAFGISLMVNVFAFYRISGGQFNPAVSTALCLVGAIPPLRAGFCIVGQIVGGIIAAAAVDGLYPTFLNVETTLGSGVSPAQGVFIEMFLTTQLILVILLLAVEKHRLTYLAPLGIGFALFVTHLAAVINRSFPSYHWIYWIGPMLGALLASGFYTLLDFCKWKQVNPGQDWDGIGEKEAQRDDFDGARDPLTRVA